MKKIISTSASHEETALEAADADLVDSADEAEVLHFTVGLGEHGLRLDKALALWVPACSRSYLAHLVEQGAATLGGQGVNKPAVKLRAGQAVSLHMRPVPALQAFAPQDVPFDTVYLDDHLRVVYKHAGLVVHPGAGNWDGTLLNGLLHQDPQAALLPRAGIVHRLDKDTSGLMVVARSRLAMDDLVQQMAQRDIERLYVAWVHGPWKHPSPLCIEGWMGRDAKVRTRMALSGDQAPGLRHSRTHVWRLDGHAQATLVGCKLDTGRTHQVRVHLSHVKHPLVGDAVYGGVAAWGMQRQALHACQLSLWHPHTRERMTWRAELPPDFSKALELSGLQYNAAWTSELTHP